MKILKQSVILASIVVFLIINLAFAYENSKGSDFEIKFGLMKKNKNGNYYVYSETTAIPMYYMNTGFRFGYTVNHKKGDAFTVYTIIYLPSSPHHIEGKDLNKIKKGEGGKIIQTDEYPVKKDSFLGFWNAFNEGDPLGDYKYEIYVNNKLERIIFFKVIKPSK